LPGDPAEQLGELAPTIDGAEQAGERLDALVGLAELALDLDPEGDRGGAVAERAGGELGDLDEIGAALVRLDLGVGAAPQGGDERLPALHRGEQADAGVEGLTIIGVGVEAALPEVEGAAGVAELLREVGGLAEQGGGEDSVGLERGEALEHALALVLAAELAEQLGEVVGDPQGGRVGDAWVGEHGGVELAGAGLVAEEVAAQVGGLDQEGDAAVAVGGGGGGGDQRLGVGARFTCPFRQVAEVAVVFGEGRVDREDRRVVIDGEDLAAEGDLPLGELAVEADLAARLDEGEGGLEDADDLAGELGVLVEGAQALERALADLGGGVGGGEHALEELAAAAIARLLVEQLLGLGEGGVGAAQAVEQALGDLQLEAGGGLVAEQREALAPEIDEVLPAALALEQALERGGELLVAAAQRHELLQVADRPRDLAGEVLGDARGLVEDGHPTITVADGGEGPVVEAEQVVPAAGEGEHRGEPLKRPLGGGVERQHPLEHGDLGGRVLAEPFDVEAGRPHGEALGGVGGEVVADELAVEGGDLVGAA
jgi:hypothetical protein